MIRLSFKVQQLYMVKAYYYTSDSMLRALALAFCFFLLVQSCPIPPAHQTFALTSAYGLSLQGPVTLALCSLALNLLVALPSSKGAHTLLTITGKMIAAMVDLRIQSSARQRICTRVNRWILRRGTWRRKAWSGWCLAGMRKSLQRSQNWQEYGIGLSQEVSLQGGPAGLQEQER